MSPRLLTIACLFVLCAGWYLVRRSHTGASPTSSSPSLPLGQEAVYLVDVRVFQGVQDRSLMLQMEGALQQWEQKPGELVSQWEQLDHVRLLGQDLDQSTLQRLTKTPVLSILNSSTHSFTHSFDPAFPPELRAAQANLLLKLLVPFQAPMNSSSATVLSEVDDLGPYHAQYEISSEADAFRVQRKWLNYDTQAIQIETPYDTLHYTLNKEARLVSVTGSLSLRYSTGDVYTTVISARLKTSSTSKVVHTHLSNAVMETYKDASASSVTAGQSETLSSALEYGKALEILDRLEENSPATEAYNVFTAIKSGLIQNPEHAPALIEKIRQTSARDASAQRRLQIMFGALAQSQSSTIAESLAELAEKCSDDFCRIQALVATSDHPHPTDAVAERLIALTDNQQSRDVIGTALLSLGSVAQKLESTSLDIPRQLMSKIQDSRFDDLKSTILAAMGNHADRRYFPTLEQYAGSKDPLTRSAAIYSLRNIPQDEANGLLLKAIHQETNRNVLIDAYKAVDYRKLSKNDYQDLALHAASVPDQDIQQAAARVLIAAYKEDSALLTPSIETLRSQTQIGAIRDYLNSELKPSH